MPDVSPTQQQTPVAKKSENKIIITALVAICGIVMITYIIATSFTAKKHTSPNQPNLANQNPPTNPPKTQGVQPLPQINAVTLTKNGFTPSKIEIHKGTAVRWINNSGTDNASVNSDDYPTNQRWPELNLGKFNNGAGLAHIFTSTGTYTYHNQFKPKQKGTIVVE